MHEQLFLFFKHHSVTLLFPTAAALLSLLLTRFCIGMLPKFGFVDLPDPRRIHTKPIPRGGGIAMIAAFFLVSILFCRVQNSDATWTFLFHFSIPAAVIAVTGIVDDRVSLPSRLKLAAQVFAGLILWTEGYCFDSLFGLPMPELVSLGATLFWVVAIINAFNLIDGMDGLAAGLAVISATCMLVWTVLSPEVDYHFSVFLLIFCGCCVGFLWYNFSPARIFMGDTGSMFIGLFFAYVSLQAVGRTVTITSLTVPLLAMGVPLLDVSLAFWRRLARRFSASDATGIMTADRDHLHHRLLAHFHSAGQAVFCSANQRRTAFYMYGLGLFLACAGILAMAIDGIVPALGYGVLLLVAVFIIRRFANIELFDSSLALAKRAAAPRRLLLLQFLLPVFDIGAVIFAQFCCLALFRIPGGVSLSAVTALVIALIAVQFLLGTYRIYWPRCTTNDFRTETEALLLGAVIGSSIAACVSSRYPLWGAMIVTYSLMVTFLGVAVRFCCWYSENYILRHLYLKRNRDTPMRPIVLVGGGLHCRLFLNLYFGSSDMQTTRIIGIVDDNPIYRNLRLYGFLVLGSSQELERIYQNTPFEEMIVTTQNLQPEHYRVYSEFCALHNLELRQFTCDLGPVAVQLAAR